MENSVQSVWLRKAGALVAFSAYLSASAPVLANSWTGQIPLASTVPLSLAHTATPLHANITHAANQQSLLNSLNASHASALAGRPVTQWVSHSAVMAGATTAVTVPPRSLFAPSTASAVSGPGLQLDLASTNANIVLGGNIFTARQSVSILVGDRSQSFSAGASVTAAEYVAIRQVLAGGHQTLALSTAGTATGGNFSINAVSSSGVGELVVPKGVTALDYSAAQGTGQAVTGDILNYGTIYGVAKAGQGNTVSLNALDITNETGGLIATKVPATVLAAAHGLFGNVNLNLSADDTLTNSGTITASGSLNLASGSGAFNNTGLLNSLSGNVNFVAPVAANVVINGAGGSVQALKGDINVRDAAYTGAGNITLSGGDYLSRNLNLFSGSGNIDGSVGQLTGALNTVAGADHLTAATDNLVLGKNTVSGDPTFVNSSGNIEIDGLNTFGEDVAIIANGNITANATGQIVTNGHDITLISGANVTTTSPDSSTVSGITPGFYPGQATSSVSISSTNPSIGDIYLLGSTVVNVLDSSSTSASGNAGNINLIAFNGSVYTAATSVINAQGSGSGNGGNVTVIAPGLGQPYAISLGGVNTGGGSAGGTGGTINLIATAPTATNASQPVVYGTDGKLTANSLTASPVDVNALGSFNSSVNVAGDLITAAQGQSGVSAGTNGASAGAVNIQAVGTILTRNILAFGGGGAGGDETSVNGGQGGAGGAITVTSLTDSISINGDVNASGGGGGGAGAFDGSGGNGGTGGSAGAVNISVSADPGSGFAPSLAISGNVYALAGGNGGNSGAASAGGGGASYGGGGGGGSYYSTTGGVNAGAGGGAGYFGGAGGNGNVSGGTGGGGGYTAGASGNASISTGAGSLGVGGDGSGTTLASSPGGQLASALQGGVGASTGGTSGNNIPLTSGGGAVTITGGNYIDLSSNTNVNGTVTLGGDIAGGAVNLTLPAFKGFSGNIVGTSSVGITMTTGLLTQPLGDSISTSNLAITVSTNDVNGTPENFSGVGSATLPLTTNAPNITLSGTVGAVFITDNAVAPNNTITLNTANLSGVNTLKFSALQPAVSLLLQSLPNIQNLTINMDTTLNTGGTIVFTNSSALTTGDLGSVTLAANDISFSNNLAINADNSAAGNFGVGGTISITTNNINGGAVSLGTASGQLSLSAQGIGTIGSAGSITLTAPNSPVTLGSGGLNVGYLNTVTNGSGGTLNLNVGSIAGSAGTLLTLAANGVGTGNGGNITLKVNSPTSAPVIGLSAGDISFQAVNGNSGTTTSTGGTVSFTALTSQLISVDPSAIQVSSNYSGATANVNGGSVTLSAANIQAVSGPTLSIINDGFGVGAGGKIFLTTTGAATLGQAGTYYLAATSGVLGGNGGQVSFTTTGPLTLTADATTGDVLGDGSGDERSVNVSPLGTSGTGGIVNLSASTITSNLAGTLPILFTNKGIGSGSGGAVTLDLTDGSLSAAIGKAAGNLEFNVSNGATGLSSGRVVVDLIGNGNSAGILAVDPSAIILSSVSKTNPNVNGGLLSVQAPTVIASSAVSIKNPLILNVSGAGKGSGGAVFYAETNTNSAAVIGNKAGQVELLANAGTAGNGGSISVLSDGNLTVNVTGIGVKATGTAGNGGGIALGAGNASSAQDGTTGNLIVVGSLSANAAGKGGGGRISVSSTSSIPFNIGLASKNLNGVEGALSASGDNGEITIGTSGIGGIVVQRAITNAEYITITYNANASGDLLLNSGLGSTKTAEIYIAPIGAASGMPTDIIAGTSGKLTVSTVRFFKL